MKPQAYTWRGEVYFGAEAVAIAANCKRNAVFDHLKRYGTLDSLGRDYSAPVSLPKAPWEVER